MMALTPLRTLDVRNNARRKHRPLSLHPLAKYRYQLSKAMGLPPRSRSW